MNMAHAQHERYKRHIILPQVGAAGQEKLLASRVLIVGLGGLGSPAALYLAAAGIGILGIADSDRVEISNLQRQIMHSSEVDGMLKTQSARERIRLLNSDVRVIAHEVRLDAQNAPDLIRSYDVVVDCSDNFETRYVTNDACVALGKPNVFGAITQFTGQASVYYPPSGPCYRCLFPEPVPPEAITPSAQVGVLGVVPGVIGTIQATETIKLLLGIGQPLIGRFLIYDALEMEFRTVSVRRSPECSLCGANPAMSASFGQARAVR